MIQTIKAQLGKAAGLVLIFTLICGVIYTLAVTAFVSHSGQWQHD